MSDMKHTLLLCLAAFALAACTQDELAEQPTALPEGAYPITFSAVQVAEALPQTRVTETSDGMGSAWNERTGDMIIVKVSGGGNDAETKCSLSNNGQIATHTEYLWWHTTNFSSVNAWYSNLKGSNTSSDMFAVTLANQTTDNGLAYVLKADEVKANYQTGNITLTFRHQLAKIRVKLDGAKADEVTSVSVKSRTSCTVAEGNVTAGTDEGYIAMRPATYNGQTYWEANVVPGVEIKDFRLNGNVDCQLTQTVMPQAGHVHEVNINIKPKFSIVDNDGNPVDAGNINTDVTITGASDQPITITGTCHVTLKDVSLNVGSGNAINITSGTPTIHVIGNGNSVSSGNNTGIAVSGGATVTIEGNSTADVLTANGGNGGAGIGSPLGGTTAGNVSINNVTINATGGSGNSAFGGAGIGSSGSGNCGDVTITDAVIMANGGDYSSGIGMGYGNTSQPSIGKITITNSDVTAKAGRYASAIGFSYTESVVNPTPDYRAGQIIITTDNLETFLSKLTAGGTAHAEFAAYAQRIGVGSHAIPYPPSLLNQDGSGPWEGVVINGTVYADGYE